MIKFDFTNKNVIVTGASMGLGKEIAKQFAIAHANVIIADLNLEVAEKTKKRIRSIWYKDINLSNRCFKLFKMEKTCKLCQSRIR